MSGFKLLAIRPLEGCDSDFSKKLKLGEVYKFYQDYTFLDINKNEICSKNNNLPASVHSILPGQHLDIYTKKRNLKINVSAIVGKNGSGKSTLFELFFLVLFVKSAESNLLDLTGEIAKTEERIGLIEIDLKIEDQNIESYFNDKDLEVLKRQIRKRENLDSQLTNERGYLRALKNAQNFAETTSAAVEIYFEINQEISRITLLKDNEEYNKTSEIQEFALSIYTVKQFFYSISLNYSLYGLNAKHMGKWIERLFHKNDAYHTPIVINPMRTNGDIDINIENDLAQSRILTNLVDQKLKQKQIVKGKVVEKIQFSIPSKKLDKNIYYISKGESPMLPDQSIPSLKIIKIPEDYQEVFDLPSGDRIFGFFGITEMKLFLGGLDPAAVEKYIFQKMFKIARTYPQFSPFLQKFDSSKEVLFNLTKFIETLKKDKTHKTLKLRQIINVLKYGILSDELGDKSQESDLKWQNNSFELKFSDYAKNVNRAYERALVNAPEEKHDLIEFVPNGFFVPKVRFKGEGKFESLSSGEQQYYNAINTIVYHVLNLDSIKRHYSRVNILFDEVELYFHPEFQRTFISDVINALNNLNLDNIKEVNILFSTHSPFILSDIPSSKILRLENGIPKNDVSQTFGANIHDLLANDFFLKEGFMGEFAKEKIEAIIKGLTILINQKEIEKINNSYNSNSLPNYVEMKKRHLEEEVAFLEGQNKAITSEKEIKAICGLIGEPVLKIKIEQMVKLAFES